METAGVTGIVGATGVVGTFGLFGTILSSFLQEEMLTAKKMTIMATILLVVLFVFIICEFILLNNFLI
jgi:nitrate/nitrite transporter NarK